MNDNKVPNQTTQASVPPTDDSTDKQPSKQSVDKDARSPLENNVMFVGRRESVNKETGKTEMISVEAPRRINDGETAISLPDADEQKNGFYSKHAAQLVALFPDDYKLIVPKG